MLCARQRERVVEQLERAGTRAEPGEPVARGQPGAVRQHPGARHGAHAGAPRRACALRLLPPHARRPNRLHAQLLPAAPRRAQYEELQGTTVPLFLGRLTAKFVKISLITKATRKIPDFW
jgi:hypothetical protein